MGWRGRNSEWHTAYDKNKLHRSYEKLGADLLEDIPFDAVAFGVMKAKSDLCTDEEQGTEFGRHEPRDDQ